MDFYEKAFGFREKRRLEAEGFTLVYLSDGVTDFELELTSRFASVRVDPFRRGDPDSVTILF